MKSLPGAGIDFRNHEQKRIIGLKLSRDAVRPSARVHVYASMCTRTLRRRHEAAATPERLLALAWLPAACWLPLYAATIAPPARPLPPEHGVRGVLLRQRG